MSKVITLSRTFPAYHPKAGQPTHFAQQVLNSLGIEWDDLDYLDLLHELNPGKEDIVYDFFCEFYLLHFPYLLQKLHTIRANWTNKKTGETYQVWKQGDKASLRVWSGVPYRSPQIIIAPDVELVKVGDFEKKFTSHSGMAPFINGRMVSPDNFCDVAENDGLEYHDLLAWFKWSDGKPFDGQILCWKEVSYV